MKVRFFSDYTNSAVLLNRFKANYIIDDNELDFTTSNDYDFAVVFNRANEPIIPGVKIITVIQEPSFSEAHQYRTFLAYSDYLLVHDPGLFERTWNIKLSGTVIESPAYMFYDDKIDHSFFDGKENVKKNRKLSMIVSSLYLTRGNYLKRLVLLDKILQSDLDIDIYGRGFTIPDPRYKGQLEYKHTGLLPYEYSIAIENSNEKNYISEKFVDCVLCNTIPIYNGAPNVGEVYDERYLRKIDLDSPSVIDDIKAIIAQPAPPSTVNKDIYFEKYNLYTKLKEVIFEIDPQHKR